MSFILEIVGRALFSIFWWLLLFPVLWVVATPVILVAACFTRLSYWSAIWAFYSCVADIWVDLGSEICTWI